MDETQTKIVEKIKNKNICVDAAPGSGKSYVAIKVLEKYGGMYLSYNKSIESEMKIKTEHVKDKDIIVTTFHAYINNYFTNCKNDDDLIGFIKKLSSGEKLISRKDCIDIKVFILDEAQDLDKNMIFILKKLISLGFIKYSTFLVLGDVNQQLYSFRNSTDAVLKNPNEIFEEHFERIKMDCSYRLTPTLSNFVNSLGSEKQKCVGKNKNIDSVVEYVTIKTSCEIRQIVRKIFHDIKMYGIDNVCILCKSTKYMSKNLQLIVDDLLNIFNIKIICSHTIDKNLSIEKQLNLRLLVSTYCFSKGLTKTSVYIDGFDMGLYKRMYTYGGDRRIIFNTSPFLIPNDVYVALTRSNRRLVLMNNNKNDVTMLPDNLKTNPVDVATLKKTYERDMWILNEINAGSEFSFDVYFGRYIKNSDQNAFLELRSGHLHRVNDDVATREIVFTLSRHIDFESKKIIFYSVKWIILDILKQFMKTFQFSKVNIDVFADRFVSSALQKAGNSLYKNINIADQKLSLLKIVGNFEKIINFLGCVEENEIFNYTKKIRKLQNGEYMHIDIKIDMIDVEKKICILFNYEDVDSTDLKNNIYLQEICKIFLLKYCDTSKNNFSGFTFYIYLFCFDALFKIK